MSRRLLAAIFAAVLFMVLATGTALAHEVGEEGTPSCFGERISHGSANWNAFEGHGLTPPERAALLEDTLTIFYPISPPEFQEYLTNFFGEDLHVSVQEMTRWVRANCAGEVPFPEE